MVLKNLRNTRCRASAPKASQNNAGGVQCQVHADQVLLGLARSPSIMCYFFCSEF